MKELVELSVKHVQVRLEPEEHELLKARAGKGSVQGYVRSLVRELIGLAEGKSPSVEDVDLHAKLDYVLSQGDEEDRTGIRKNLEWAVSDIHSRGPKRKQASGS